jgi:hypothetical protein
LDEAGMAAALNLLLPPSPAFNPPGAKRCAEEEVDLGVRWLLTLLWAQGLASRGECIS